MKRSLSPKIGSVGRSSARHGSSASASSLPTLLPQTVLAHQPLHILPQKHRFSKQLMHPPTLMKPIPRKGGLPSSTTEELVADFSPDVSPPPKPPRGMNDTGIYTEENGHEGGELQEGHHSSSMAKEEIVKEDETSSTAEDHHGAVNTSRTPTPSAAHLRTMKWMQNILEESKAREKESKRIHEETLAMLEEIGTHIRRALTPPPASDRKSSLRSKQSNSASPSSAKKASFQRGSSADETGSDGSPLPPPPRPTNGFAEESSPPVARTFSMGYIGALRSDDDGDEDSISPPPGSPPRHHQNDDFDDSPPLPWDEL